MPTVVLARGVGLGEVRRVDLPSGLQAKVLSVSAEPSKTPGEPAVEIARIEMLATGEGARPFRLITSRGLTNEAPVWVTGYRVLTEEGAASAPVDRFPIGIAGAISQRGEVDRFWITVSKGEVLSLSASGGKSPLDPVVAIVESSGSWFDPKRLNTLSWNDEPLQFPGLPSDARLTRRFERSGTYGVEVRSFSGQGGPDFTYTLKIEPGFGEPPSLRPQESLSWEERSFVRPLHPERGAALVARAGVSRTQIPPRIFEGRLHRPAETQRFSLRSEGPEKIAIEIETPEATLPRFNPVVRLLDAQGAEIATNVYTKLNNNGLYMMKMIQAKTILTLPSAGEYTIEMRDITTDIIADDFAYRLLVRPQIPHIGRVEAIPDCVNLAAGQTKSITVNLDYEEGFSGVVFAEVSGLPPGVSATVGLAKPVDKPPLPNGGRLERYFADAYTATISLSAAEDALLSDEPVPVRVSLRAGKVSGEPIFVKEVPLMVIARSAS